MSYGVEGREGRGKWSLVGVGGGNMKERGWFRGLEGGGLLSAWVTEACRRGLMVRYGEKLRGGNVRATRPK
jgi:hypothetical protein